MDLPDSLPEGQYAVYALIDPTDQLVYYVGQTRNPKQRVMEHFKRRHDAGRKADHAFYPRRKAQPQPKSQPEPEAQSRLASSKSDTSSGSLFKEWLASLHHRVAASSQSSAALLGWTPLLSAAHLADVQALFSSLAQATGRTQSQLEQELLETFGVLAINTIPDEQWQDVLAWCIRRAQQQR